VTPRQRRLTADAEALRAEFAEHPVVTVEPVGWSPAERYRVTFAVPSARIDQATGQPAVADEHEVEMDLLADYPRVAPRCTAVSSVFHPNFGAAAGEEIGLTDPWAPSRTLVDIVVEISRLLQYQAYDVASRRNPVAAQWAIQNPDIFPLGEVQLFQSDPEPVDAVEAAAGSDASMLGAEVAPAADWWRASDGRWYPPELTPGPPTGAAPPEAF